MAITPTELKTLDYCFKGQPFVSISAKSSIDLGSLDLPFRGEPFVGNSGEDTGGGENTSIQAERGIVTASGRTSGITTTIVSVVSGSMIASGSSGNIVPIVVIPGAPVSIATGSVLGVACIVLPGPGEVFVVATCGDFGMPGIILAVPGNMTVSARNGQLRFQVQAPIAMEQASASVEDIGIQAESFTVTAERAAVIASGRIAGFVPLSVQATALINAIGHSPSMMQALPIVLSEVSVQANARTRVWKAQLPVVTYQCLLTGGADGLDDVVIPISSFQFRKRAL